MTQKQHRKSCEQFQNEMCNHPDMCNGLCTPKSPRLSVEEVHCQSITSSPTYVGEFSLGELPSGNELSTSQAPNAAKIHEGSSKQVCFSDLNVREYNLVMGDKSSLATELGWHVHQEYSKSIDIYESTRKPRRSGDDLVLRRKQKKERLHMAGCSEMEVFLAKREQQLREREEFFGTSAAILGARLGPGRGGS